MNYTITKERCEPGLTSQQVNESRLKHGSNKMTPPRRRGFFSHFIENLGDPVIRVLLLALGVNILFLFRSSDKLETIGIAVSVFLATFISTLSEQGSENAFQKLSEMAGGYFCRVRRDGATLQIPMEEIVVGDIVLLSAGDKIPADGFIISGTLGVDQSAMTGETKEIRKYPCRGEKSLPSSHSALFRECVVVSGEGEMLVSVIGDKTFIGEISKEISMDTRQSPLKLRLTKLAGQISRLGYAAAILVGLVYLINVFALDCGMDRTIILSRLRDIRFLASSLLNAFTLGLTVVVVAVPEGLPMMIAVVLSSNIKKMAHDMVLVRKPVGIEAAGSMNILFTDKTGTLTEGKLCVSEIFNAEMDFSSVKVCRKNADGLYRYLHGCLIAGSPCEYAEDKLLGGNATERALVEAIPSDSSCYHVISKKPFDSDLKYSAVSVSEFGGVSFFKGAPEKLLPYVQNALDKNGKVVPLDKMSLLEKMHRLTQSGARVILTAFTKGQRFEPDMLTLIACVAMSDHIRKEAKHSVDALESAGIQVVMITGDNIETARSIAHDCGILRREKNLCLDSSALAAMSDGEIASVLPKLAVVARALPADKSRLVRIAQECSLVCGMTGDGINDAPALKRADIGFAMGNGTQVAKEAGDIIILDNNLASIVRAVLYGRNIFKSIRKFIVLQLTMNFCAVGVTMICPFLGIDSPVTVVQMLWINIIMDSLGGLAFAGEPPLPSCMKEKPKRRDEPILNAYMVNQILTLGGFTIALSLFFLKSHTVVSHFREAEGNIYLLTAFFAFFIFAGVLNCFNARTDRLDLLSGIGKNKPFLIIMFAISVIQIGFVYLGGDVLRTTPLLPAEMFTAFSMALCVIPAEFCRKLFWKLVIGKPGY